MALLPRRDPIPERTAVNVDWLVRLRWAEVVGQSATVLVAQVVFGVALPIVPLLLVVGVGLMSNLALEVWLGRGGRDAERPLSAANVSEAQLAGVMALDVVLLTALLFLSGGPLNPFGSLYLVQIALATVMVRAAWIWMLVALSFVGFGLLLIAHEPLPMPDSTRMVGMWFALGVASAFVVHFLVRITGALSAREAELEAARHLAARQERLASLATMAAGAAHELSTPLGTVALAAKELERALIKRGASGERSAEDDALIEDARLIREQVGRCRLILDQMAQGAGTIGESLTRMSVRALIEEALTGTRAAPVIRQELASASSELSLEVPRVAVTSALRSLITNAQDASPPDQPVVVRTRAELAPRPGSSGSSGSSGAAGLAVPHIVIVIADRGSGMDAELLARIGEPFFTTKAPGRGMGLGMFLSRAVVEGVGGSLTLESSLGHGTTAQVTLPLTPIAVETRGRDRASQPEALQPSAPPASPAPEPAAPAADPRPSS